MSCIYLHILMQDISGMYRSGAKDHMLAPSVWVLAAGLGHLAWHLCSRFYCNSLMVLDIDFCRGGQKEGKRSTCLPSSVAVF